MQHQSKRQGEIKTNMLYLVYLAFLLRCNTKAKGKVKSKQICFTLFIQLFLLRCNTKAKDKVKSKQICFTLFIQLSFYGATPKQKAR